MREDLGPWWEALPEGALRHDPNAYLKAHEAATAGPTADSVGATGDVRKLA